MSIVAAVKRAIGSGAGDHWKLELPEPAQSAAYLSEVLEGRDAWNDAWLMKCATKYGDTRRFYQNKPVFDI